MMRQSSGRVLSVTLALVFGLAGLGSTAVENPAAWEAAAAYVAGLPDGFNGVRGEILKAKLDAGEAIFLLDVRQPNEFAAGRIEGAVNVPVREVPKAIDKIPSDKSAPIVVVCASGIRAAYVVMALNFKGYTDVKDLVGGMAGWEKAGYPVVK